jgi:hypothetical protein
MWWIVASIFSGGVSTAIATAIREVKQLPFSLRFSGLVFLISTSGLVVIMLVAKRRSRTVPPSSTAAIIGKADLLIHRFNKDDLVSVDEFVYRINLGVFIRTTVAVIDKPRTISSFRLDLYAEDAKYSAHAEREISDYRYRYEKEVYDELGNSIIRTFREEMPNLFALVRTTPIAPNTQAEGWLRFELKDVKGSHEPWHRGKINLYAMDVRDTPYVLNTDNIRIREINSSEYAELKRHL